LPHQQPNIGVSYKRIAPVHVSGGSKLPSKGPRWGLFQPKEPLRYLCVSYSMKSILLCLLVTVALALTAAAADISGKWTGSFTPENGDAGSAYVILKQSGTTLTGSAGPNANEQWPGLQGTIGGNKVSFQVKSASDGTLYKCDLELGGDHLKGDVTFTSAEGQSGKAKLDLTRASQ